MKREKCFTKRKVSGNQTPERDSSGYTAAKAFLAVFLIAVLASCSLKQDMINEETGAGDGIWKRSEVSDQTNENADAPESGSAAVDENGRTSLVNPDGMVIQKRFLTPEGFERITVEDGSFGAYLRNLPLKPHGSRVSYYNGEVKPRDVHEAVIDMDVGERDLQQCADAVMRLWAEYLYGKGLYHKIHFNFVNGFKADYSTWMQGNRIVVEGNKAYWVKRTGYSDDYGSFRQYLDMVFAYANTVSLEGEMKKVPLEEMRIGDVFLKGQLPGHCVIIVDMAENKDTGEKLFMIAQSYMPAQDIHILKNPSDAGLSPWYRMNFGDVLDTPEWRFTRDQLVRFE